MKYDYLIVGAGLYGAVFAQEQKKKGKTSLLIDRRDHVAGNVYTQEIEGIHVHQYGAHIFHTSDERVWKYVNQFVRFKPFINSPVANYKGTMYNLPFNMNTFSKMWGVTTPQEAKDKIQEQVKASGIINPSNLEEKAISLVGTDIYETLIRGYTEKQWGKPCADLPADIISRLPLRFTYDNNYFNDLYQGIPVGGYTAMIEKLCEGSDVLLNTDYRSFIAENPDIAKQVLYTGSIDELLDYELGELEYRSLRFEEKILSEENMQGNAVVNYAEREVPYTRIIEHKFFQWENQEKTVVSYEYPVDWSKGMEAYYPVNDEKNQKKYFDYVALLKERYPTMLLGGRLGLYRYMDMDKIIAEVLDQVN